MLLTCAVAAIPLFAQTSSGKKTTKPAPSPAPAAEAAQTETTTTTTTTAVTTDVPSSTPHVTADTDQDANNPRALKLSLDTAVRTSISQNLGIDLTRYDYRESAESLAGTYSIFDLYTTAQLNKNKNISGAASAFSATSNGQTTANLAASQELPTGGSYTVFWDNSRKTATGGGASLNPSLGTTLGFSVAQPLARNFGVDVTERNIFIARNNLGISGELFRGMLLDTTNNVEQAYLNLVYARQFVDVAKESLFLARDQSRITQIRIDVGASAPLDILQPRVQIATSEEALIQAVANVRAAEDTLRQLMNLPAAEWDRPIIPTDTVTYVPLTIDVEASIAHAWELRPEIRENNLTIANRRVTYNYARNQVLPQFDVVAGYNASGLAGRSVNSQTGVPTGQETNFGNALNQAFRNDLYGWNIGINVGVPVFNIGARAEARRAKLDLERATVVQDQSKQSIAIDVRTQARNIDTNAKQIAATRAARDAAEKNLDAERKRYENGMVTNFEVLQIQQQLSDARANELQALVNYQKSIVLFHHSVGDLLDLHGVTVQVPEATKEPSFFTRFDRYNWLNFAAHDTDAQKEAVPATPATNGSK
jgi:HAE1 family hydrophobic/amphiphilic exporter-1